MKYLRHTLLLLSFHSISLFSQDLSKIYEKVKRAVVQIETTPSSKDGVQYGTGFFVSNEGVLVTNYHVIRDAISITVLDQDGKAWSTVMVGHCDRERDLASLHISNATTTFIKVQDPPSFKIGQRVIAIGNPRGLENTLSEGIISGIRKISDSLGNVIQTTAPISPGSSGGPLLSIKGEAIGVTTFQVIGGQNLNFAVPMFKFVKSIPTHKWLTVSEWRKELVRPEVEKTLRMAKLDLELGRRESARQLLNSVLHLDDSNTDALLILSRMLVSEWNNSEAIRLLRKYTSVDSSNAEAFYLQGKALDKLGKSKQAMQSYEKAVALDSTLASVHYELAMIYRLDGKLEKSRFHLDRLRELNPDLLRQIQEGN